MIELTPNVAELVDSWPHAIEGAENRDVYKCLQDVMFLGKMYRKGDSIMLPAKINPPQYIVDMWRSVHDRLTIEVGQ